MRREDLFEAALEESGRVREEFGWPIMVTPFSQFVGTQAVMNVMAGERYANVPDDVIVYFLGQFGEPPAPHDPDVADRVLSLPRAKELREVEPLSMDDARAKFGSDTSEEELLLRLTMPAEQVDAMVQESRAQRPAPTRPGRDPVVRLLREVSRRPSITYMRLTKGEDTIVWRRDPQGGHAA
jgi:oxaloacetate decarboxylase alpha subunit